MPDPIAPETQQNRNFQLSSEEADGVRVPETAMVLAAGRGTRMRPLSDELPKPLLSLGGKPMLDWILDRLIADGVRHVVVNLHHQAGLIRDHVTARGDAIQIDFSEESEPLETGGGIKQALPLLGDDPILLINGDTVWLDGPTPMLKRLAARWSPDDMDAVLLMVLAPRAPTYDGPGDYFMAPDGRLTRRLPNDHLAPYVYGSVQITRPRIYADGPDGPFRSVGIWDQLQEAERLFGLVHDGAWFSPNTPQQLAAIDPLLDERNARWLDL